MNTNTIENIEISKNLEKLSFLAIAESLPSRLSSRIPKELGYQKGFGKKLIEALFCFLPKVLIILNIIISNSVFKNKLVCAAPSQPKFHQLFLPPFSKKILILILFSYFNQCIITIMFCFSCNLSLDQVYLYHLRS